jgi:hypothetical protein
MKENNNPGTRRRIFAFGMAVAGLIGLLQYSPPLLANDLPKNLMEFIPTGSSGFANENPNILLSSFQFSINGNEGKVVGETYEIERVYDNGFLTRLLCGVKNNECAEQTLDIYDEDQLSLIRRWVHQTQVSAIQQELWEGQPKDILCMAIPKLKSVITMGNNHQFIYYAEFPCGYSALLNSPESMQLIEFVNRIKASLPKKGDHVRTHYLQPFDGIAKI